MPALACALSACGASGPNEADWPPLGKKWFDRANASYRSGDMEDAAFAVDNALKAAGQREEVRLLAARVALSELEYDRAIEVLRGIDSSDARALRGRSYWYQGSLDKAADELERLLADPEVVDPWAVDVAKLARRGVGRRPFSMTGGLLAVTEMPHVGSTAMIVPVEVNGQPALGLIATGTAEAVLDSGTSKEPSWISLRFGERIEVRDVPALAKDLSGISRQLNNTPIKVLLGVNLLRHLSPTIDLSGGQFVVRSFEPPAPPHATTLKVSYVRGGGMLLRTGLGPAQEEANASFLVDTTMTFPLALDDAGWKKAGIELSSLRPLPNGGKLSHGLLPMLRLGAFEVPGVPGVRGAPVGDVEKGLDIDIDGLMGSGLLAAFRVTLVDRGRTMWLEDAPAEAYARSAAENAPLHGPRASEAPESEPPASETPASGPARTPPGAPSAPSPSPPNGASN